MSNCPDLQEGQAGAPGVQLQAAPAEPHPTQGTAGRPAVAQQGLRSRWRGATGRPPRSGGTRKLDVPTAGLGTEVSVGQPPTGLP
jgi:hypothetical protein